MCKMQYKLRVSSVQCSVCSMKCTGACAGAVYGVHCEVCSVLPAIGEDLEVEKKTKNNSLLGNVL